MAWDGNGNYSRSNGVNSGSTVWQDDASAGTDIEADLHDVHDEDLATAIGACLTKNNETKPTAHFLPNADDSYNLGSTTVGWGSGFFTGGVVFDERADHATTPAAGRGEVWVKSDTPSSLYYTDDAGNDFALVDSGLLAGPTVGSVQASTSGTDVTFSSIPAGISQIEIIFDNVSLSGGDLMLIQLGDSGGLENTGYTSVTTSHGTSSNTQTAKTDGIYIDVAAVSDYNRTGSIFITNVNGNVWVASGSTYSNTGATIQNNTTAARKELSAVLTQIAVLADGSNTFNGGQVNIRYS